jgi:hypothetical protein
MLSQASYAGEKFLRVKGELIDEATKEIINGFKVKQVEDDLDSLTTTFDKDEFDLWVSPNRITKLYFLKDGYVVNFVLIEASFIPSIAYKKKQKIELTIRMYKATERMKRAKKPAYVAEYIAKLNAFEVKDMSLKKNQKVSAEYKPPFPAPADTYSGVKPTTKKLELTKSFNEKKAQGNTGIARVIQGILFADFNYCFFNERTNDANFYLEKLKAADAETWGSVKTIDSPDYGKIVSRTLNREQSIDTLFALGAHLETSRLIYQNFTSDSKVLIHLKTLKKVIEKFEASAPTPAVQEFMDELTELVPLISSLESTYKDLLRNKMNFEMQEDKDFLAIKKKTDEIYASVIQ